MYYVKMYFERDIIEDFETTAFQAPSYTIPPEIGYSHVSNNRPSFTLKDIKSAFPETMYLGGKDREYILDLDGYTILLFEQDEFGEVEKIYSPRGVGELTRLAAGVYSEFPAIYEYLADILELQTPSELDIAAFNKNNAKNIKDQQRIDEAKSRPVNFYNKAIDQSSCKGVVLGEYAVVDAGGDIDTIGTFGADPCLMIFIRSDEIFNPHTGQTTHARGAVIHFNSLVDASALNAVLSNFQNSEPLEVSIISGSLDRRTFLRVLDFFEDKNVVLNVDVGSHISDAVMNISTGDIVRGTPLDCGENADLRMTTNALKGETNFLSLSYDGRMQYHKATQVEYDVAVA